MGCSWYTCLVNLLLFPRLGLDVNDVVRVIPSFAVTPFVFTRVQVAQHEEGDCGSKIGGSDDTPRDMVAATH